MDDELLQLMRELHVKSPVHTEIQQIAQRLCGLYYDQGRGRLAAEDQIVLRRCHQFHLQDRNNRVNMEMIVKVVKKLPHQYFMRLLDRNRRARNNYVNDDDDNVSLMTKDMVWSVLGIAL
jgi:hypothetical protein